MLRGVSMSSRGWDTCSYEEAAADMSGVLQHSRHVPDMMYFSTSASKRSIRKFVITRAFYWLKASTTAFTFKTLLRHAKLALTPRSLNVKLGPRPNYRIGQAAIRHYANQPARPL